MQRVASSVAPAVLGGGIGGLAGGLAEPLIPKTDGGGEEEQQQQEDETPIPLSSISVITGAVLLGGAGIAASAAAMVSMTGMVAVYVAGGLCVVNSLAVVTNQYQISKGKGYRQGANDLRKEANRLGAEVDALANAVDDLQKEATLMKAFENQLSDIAIKQGISVEKLVQLTKENEHILAQQKANLKQTFLSDIAKAFITSEFLTDMKIDLKNLPLLTMRLEIQLNSHGMKLDAEKFSELVSKNNDVGNVIKQCGELLYSSNADASGLVTLTAARGERSSLASKPKHGTRNAVVRDVKKSLSMRGIEIDSDSDSDSIDSDCSDDEEAKRLFGLSSHKTEPKSRSKLHRQQEGAKSSPQKANAKQKLKASALSTLMFRTRGTRASEDTDTTSHGSKTSHSIGRKDTGSKKKLSRSLTMDTNQERTVIETPSRSSSRGNRHTRRITFDTDVEIRSSRSSSRGKKPAKFTRSSTMDGSIESAPFTKRNDDGEFSTGSSNKPCKLKRSKTVSDGGSSIGSHSSLGSKSRGMRGSSIGSEDSKGSRGRSSTAKRQGSSLHSSKKSQGAELSQDSTSRRRRVHDGSF